MRDSPFTSRKPDGEVLADRGPLPGLAIIASGVLWGLFWIPMRAADRSGVEGVWATLAFYLVSAVFLAPFAWPRRRAILNAGAATLITAAITGSAFSLYASALLLTEVVRATLLFYLTPVWSAILSRLLLGEAFTPARGLALASGVAGLFVFVGPGAGHLLETRSGDGLALLSGLFWAYGSLRMYVRGTAVDMISWVFLFFVAGGVVLLAVVLGSWTVVAAPPGRAELLAGAPLILLVVLVNVLPAVFLTLWGATRLSATRVGLLMMSEVVVGVASAAMLTDEPFGLREIAGTALIVTAAVVEFTRRPQPAVPR